jgi:hypothetical protein
VITGHLDTRSGPAVLARLKDVGRGDQVQVLRADRSVAVFVVDKVEHTPKTRFPADRVYAKLPYPGLRLVTCGGSTGKPLAARGPVPLLSLVAGSTNEGSCGRSRRPGGRCVNAWHRAPRAPRRAAGKPCLPPVIS